MPIHGSKDSREKKDSVGVNTCREQDATGIKYLSSRARARETSWLEQILDVGYHHSCRISGDYKHALGVDLSRESANLIFTLLIRRFAFFSLKTLNFTSSSSNERFLILYLFYPVKINDLELKETKLF